MSQPSADKTMLRIAVINLGLGFGCDSSDAIRQSVVKQYNYPSNMTGIIHNANIHTHYNVHIHIYTDRGYFCGNIGK